jgi:signal transduction histidine kinase
MFRSWLFWTIFAACLLVVVAAMGWISWTALRLDRLEAQSRRQADLEEKVRLALWRMDTTLAPLVAQESARPYFAYKAFFPINRAFGNMFNERSGGEALLPSPLLSARLPQILIHFQFEPDGSLTSPQVPSDSNFKLAVPQIASETTVREAETYLALIKQLVNRDKLLALLPRHTPSNVELVESPLNPLDQTPAQQQANRLQRENLSKIKGQSYVEYQQRNRAVQDSANTLLQNQQMAQQDIQQPQMSENRQIGGARPSQTAGTVMASTDLSGVLMSPLWIEGQLRPKGDSPIFADAKIGTVPAKIGIVPAKIGTIPQLILARRITISGQEYVQGCLLDWPAIKTSLLESIADLLPAANLVPVVNTSDAEGGRLLAALPVRLVPVILAGNGDGVFSPILLSLIVAWICISAAAVAVAGLLAGVIRLSQRRATFVSAVTHELRTPLTTFQMYAEMLAEGMVSDEQTRREYLNTLRAESIRLTHLVENVLSYSRLERGRTDRRLESIAIEDLLNVFKDRLAIRAKQAEMELCVAMDSNVAEQTVRANISAVEQIVFNLVDNACKYASSAENKRIDLVFTMKDGKAELSVRDYGPGLSPAACRRLFSPFSKSAQEAAHSAPGIGLGLALSRRLARDMGGDLLFDNHFAQGACFILVLPLKSISSSQI